MTKEQKILKLEKMLKKCPEMLSAAKASKWSPIGKNRVYELVKSGELRSFLYRGAYMIMKSDLIEYLAEHSDDDSIRYFHVKSEDNR